ncbi:HAD-IA family hydrolase [Allosphingosinicella vermicomposti]|uniref:HAD-IA family hydrolase n=1 Tax=Allosphingosinicella vermicomposti TaxID=614671 RepID=UPI000D10C0C5|nr:HAD-IA family hydrolase [Allosphingosinicella vermicomposti]
MNKLAIFDCDGTLVDSQLNICLAMEECFAAAKLEPPCREKTRRIVGLSLIEAMQVMLPEAESDFHIALAEDYKRAFQKMRAQGRVVEPLYDGIAELIAELDEAGWLLGVATGKSDRGLRLCLEHHGIHARFVTLQTADRHPSKPHPSMIETALAEAGAASETAMMIGDTSYDMAMARAASVTGVGVAWGYHDRETLKEAGADHIVGNPAAIAAIARSF